MKTTARLSVMVLLLVGCPLAGILLQGRNLSVYLEFPPRSQFIVHGDFFWPTFVIMGTGIVLWGALISGFVLGRIWRAGAVGKSPNLAFPAWGWLGLAAGIAFWTLAWTRYPWFSWLQPHTFTPIWLCYIVVINALTWQRQGTCMLVDRPRHMLKLFALSGAFWWVFEYLNRFVQNWIYSEGMDYSPVGYFLAASISFSTVLPAVACTREWILSSRRLNLGLASTCAISLPAPRLFAGAGLVLGCLLLMAIGVWPNVLYPLLWLAPLLVIISLQTLFGKQHLFSAIRRGDWRPVIGSALAACLCGFFWEMWNSRSLAKWYYDIPWVHQFEMFEMPILGYAGYFPFGWECAAAEDLLPNPNSTTTT